MRDDTEHHPENSILFIGSSSIRRWSHIGKDMEPYHPIQRGYGGAKWSDVAVFAERLISPHAFRAAVFFVGNDITGDSGDKSPQSKGEVQKRMLAYRDDFRFVTSRRLMGAVRSQTAGSVWEAWPKVCDTTKPLACDM